MPITSRFCRLIFTTGILLLPGFPSAQAASEAIRERVELLMFYEELLIEEEPILAWSLLPEIYARAAFEPLWTDRDLIDQLVPLARFAYDQGLDPDDYPIDTLTRLLPDEGLPENPVVRAKMDILASETLIRIAYQIRFGKVNPYQLFPDWNYGRVLLPGTDPAQLFVDTLAAGDLKKTLIETIDRGSLYAELVAFLKAHRAIAANGGWPSVPEGATLRSGSDDPRVADLRARLRASGELDETSIDSTLFGEGLDSAVRAFQMRHGLDSDGVVGPATITALNVSVETRIEQIRASLERARWVFFDGETVEDRLVLVNIAAQEVSFFQGGDIAWRTRAQIGRHYRQTPVFRDDIQYLVFNPDWTVPPGILRNDVLPRLRADPEGYLTANNMDLLTRDGEVVQVADVDWSSINPRRFPYIVRQRPGPWNAMGTVKFMFPNPHFVFLHDTTARDLFDRSQRAFSSGCVRVEDPFVLAELLFDDPASWNQARFQEILDTGIMRTVHLQKTVPVFLLYLTADLDGEGGMRFFEDIYGRDEKLLEALNADPQIEPIL